MTDTTVPPPPEPAGRANHSPLAADAADTIWSVEIVDSGAGIANYVSLALDTHDLPHIGYYDQSNTALKYARWTGVSWDIVTVDNSAAVGRYTSLALDGSNRPHISYYDQTNTALKHASWNVSWISETVDNSASVGQYTSLIVDGSGYPHISYYDQTSTALKYAHWDGSSWISETVDNSATVGLHTALAMRGTSPRISYRNITTPSLRYAVYVSAGHTWDVTDLTAAGNDAEYISMVMDSTGYEHISYFQDGSGVHYIYHDISGWHDSLVVANASAESIPTSIALDDDDHPHIAYTENNALRYAKAAYERGLYEDAIRPFAVVNKLEPKNTTALEYLGRCYEGLEKLAGIPGSVGGAISGNAGAYGKTASKFLQSLKPQL
jgi:hypothetical protein